jgi:hypothetical protein
MAHNDCDKGPVLDILVEGQKALFDKLETINGTLQQVAVQKNELEHMDKRVTAIELKCLSHKNGDKGFGTRVWQTAVLAVVAAAAVSFVGLFSFTLYRNTPAYMDYQKTQITAEPMDKHGK